MKITILGCGGSLGTPMAGGFWGDCDPNNPKNNRTRSSILVQSETTNLLVDATVELRTQLNRLNLKKLDGVLISHPHSDHVNGIDDLKIISKQGDELMNVYGNFETLEEIDRRCPYIFRPKGDDLYFEFLKKKQIENYQKFRIGDIDIESFEQDHMTCSSLGFRFGRAAYSVDVVNLNDRSLKVLEGIDIWIVDAGSYNKEETLTHANIQKVKKWVEHLKPKMTYITDLGTNMDYKTLCDELPPNIRPVYDGMEIDPEKI